MDQAKKELYISRIVAGFFRCKIDNTTYIIQQPNRNIRNIAQEVYMEALKDAELDGLYTDEELNTFLYQNEIWSSEKEEELEKIQEDIEEYKLQIFKAVFRSEERKILKEHLALTKLKLQDLVLQKTSYNHLSCSGTASMMKIRYLVGKSLKYEDGTNVWESDEFWKTTDPLLEEITNIYLDQKITESEYREIARTEPWRSTWSCRKCEREVFGVPTVDLTDEQKSLVIWSSMYDSIYEHPNCPEQEAIDDDDIIDGWMISQRKERDKHRTKVQVDDLISNSKIKNSGEVFVVGQTKKDRERIDSLNDASAKAIKRKRLQEIRDKGTVEEINMPDTRMELQMQANRSGR